MSMGSDLVVILGITGVVVVVLFGMWLTQRSQYRLKGGKDAAAWQVASSGDLQRVLGEALGVFVEWMVGFRSSPMPGGGHHGEVSWAMPRVRSTGGGMIIGSGAGDVYTQEFIYLPVDATWPLLRVIPKLVSDAEEVDTEWGDFNRRFDVRSDDREYAHAVLTGPMQELLESQPPGISLALMPGGLAVATAPGIRVGEGALRAVAEGFLSRVRPFIWTQYGRTQRPGA